MVRGARREGKELEKGGLMVQDTAGKVEFKRSSVTNSKDEGVDYIKVVKSGFDYKKYNNELKIKRDDREKKQRKK